VPPDQDTLPDSPRQAELETLQRRLAEADERVKAARSQPAAPAEPSARDADVANR